VRRGRILALDFGTKNVGLATSDELGIAVRPLPSMPNRNRRDLLHRLKTAVEELAIESLVIGIPLNMDGSTGAAVERVQRFMQLLQKNLGLPLSEVDERLSTVEAAEIWRGMNARQQKKYRTLDSLAAAIILERFLREE
jgi:putative Holliday junction resolvase